MRPLLGWYKPVSSLIKVVFPAPLLPTKANPYTSELVMVNSMRGVVQLNQPAQSGYSTNNILWKEQHCTKTLVEQDNLPLSLNSNIGKLRLRQGVWSPAEYGSSRL